MAKERFHKVDIARAQLATAIWIFLNDRDPSSAITLAGASSGILDQMVRNAGKEPFVDYACRVHREINGHTPKRESYKHHIEKTFGILAQKHLSDDDPDTVDLDLEEMAFKAIARAVSDYVTINGQSERFIQEFLKWAWDNKDGKEMMENFQYVPDKMKPKNDS